MEGDEVRRKMALRTSQFVRSKAQLSGKNIA